MTAGATHADYRDPPSGVSQLAWLEHQLHVLHCRRHGLPEPEPPKPEYVETVVTKPAESEGMRELRAAVDAFFQDARAVARFECGHPGSFRGASFMTKLSEFLYAPELPPLEEEESISGRPEMDADEVPHD